MENYTTVYGVGLLDDVHNYFPALLYDSGRFQNLTQVFHYVRHQMNSRFNLFSYGASLHASASAPAPSSAGAGTGAGTGTGAVASQNNQEPVMTPRASTRTRDVMSSAQAASVLLGFLRLGSEQETDTILPIGPGQGIADIWASYNDPIVVRPTAQAIAAGTENIDGSTLAENTGCAICQDTISNTDSARRLRACGHVYHRGCIDEWFQRSVFCPACRHDIRLPASAASMARPAAIAARRSAEGTEVVPPTSPINSFYS